MFFMVRPLATFCFWLLSILIHISIKKIVEKLKKNKHRFMVLIMLRESSCFCSSLPENCLFSANHDPEELKLIFFCSSISFMLAVGYGSHLFLQKKKWKKNYFYVYVCSVFIWHIHCWFSYVITWNCLQVMEWNIRNSTHKKYRLKELEIAIDTLLVGWNIATFSASR